MLEIREVKTKRDIKEFKHGSFDELCEYLEEMINE